mgnify:FL=1
MCKELEVLENGEHGYIEHCSDCDAFTIAFGTALVALLRDDLDVLQFWLEEELQAHKNRVCPQAKAFRFRPNFDSSYMFVLTYQEMEQMHTMITSGLLICQANMLIR